MTIRQDAPEEQPYDGKCAWCQDIVRHNEELEGDIRRLQSMIMATEDYFGEIYERHCGSPGFDYVHPHLLRAIGDPEELLRVLSEE